MPMKLNILSDLHLSCGALEPPQTDADAVILAGDITRPRQAIAWAQGFGKPVLYVAGNHECYGGSVAGTMRELKALCSGTAVRVLDKDEVIVAGVRFLGATLWTDFRLFGEGPKRAAAVREAVRCIRDFTAIRADGAAAAPFTPDDAAALFEDHARWLEGKLAEPY